MFFTCIQQGYQFADDNYEDPDVKPEEPEVQKPTADILTVDAGLKGVTAAQANDGLPRMSPNDEDVAYDDGIFTYDQYGNVIGRVRNLSARRRWHWAFTKIVQVGHGSFPCIQSLLLTFLKLGSTKQNVVLFLAKLLGGLGLALCPKFS